MDKYVKSEVSEGFYDIVGLNVGRGIGEKKFNLKLKMNLFYKWQQHEKYVKYKSGKGVDGGVAFLGLVYMLMVE